GSVVDSAVPPAERIDNSTHSPVSTTEWRIALPGARQFAGELLVDLECRLICSQTLFYDAHGGQVEPGKFHTWPAVSEYDDAVAQMCKVLVLTAGYQDGPARLCRFAEQPEYLSAGAHVHALRGL